MVKRDLPPNSPDPLIRYLALRGCPKKIDVGKPLLAQALFVLIGRQQMAAPLRRLRPWGCPPTQKELFPFPSISNLNPFSPRRRSPLSSSPQSFATTVLLLVALLLSTFSIRVHSFTTCSTDFLPPSQRETQVKPSYSCLNHTSARTRPRRLYSHSSRSITQFFFCIVASF